ncbi:MAG: hypothetical protein COA79_11575 [Planctomycetota bacterium]|nr:MAG: hypothetical protein COA79_11575 [Planctomycetota bacterium]
MGQKTLKFRTIVIIFIVLIFIPAVFVTDIRSYLLTPSNTVGPVQGRWERISFRTDLLKKEIDDLKAENLKLKIEKLKLINYYDKEYTQKWSQIEKYIKQVVAYKKGVKASNNYLKDIRYLRPLKRVPIPANVIGELTSQWDRLLELDRGEKHGIKVNFPVVVGGAIVGKIIAVTPWTSTMSHITNKDIKVPCVLANSENLRGLMVGSVPKVRGEFSKIKYLDRRGDIILGVNVFSLGISKQYPPGFLLGKVRKKSKKESEMYYSVEMSPAVPFYLISNVIILKPVDELK